MNHGPLGHKQWFYHPDLGGHLFEIGDIVPDDWYDTPDDFPNKKMPTDIKELKSMGKGALLKLAAREGIDVDPTAHFFTIVSAVKRGLKI